MNQQETTDPICSMNDDQAGLRDLFNVEVECRLADLLHGSIATAAENTFMDAMQLATDSVVLHKKSTFNGLIDVLISLLIESGHFDFNRRCE